jgi:hypothetical protein
MRELLDIAKDDAPPARLSVDDIVSAGRRRKRWAVAQRIGGAAAVAAAAAVTATVLVVTQGMTQGTRYDTRVGSPPKESVPVQAAPAPPFTFTFEGYSAAGYRVITPREVTATYQAATIVGPATDSDGKPRSMAVGTMTVFQPGAFNTEQVRTGSKLTVMGRDAYQTSLARERMRVWHHDGTTDPAATVQATVLAWQYDENAWAVIEEEIYFPHQFTVPAMVAVAEMLRMNGEVTARLPFRTGYLPAGWTLQSVSGRSFDDEDTGMVRAVYAAPDAGFGSLTGPRDFDQYTASPSVVIAILHEDAPPPDAPKKKNICIDGDHWCTWSIPGTGMYIAVNDPSKTLPDEELLRIGQSLTFADFTQPATWPAVI